MSIPAISSELAIQAAPALAAVSAEAPNFIIRIQALVGRILVQLGRMSDETRSREETLKKEYRIKSLAGAEYQKQQGNAAPVISVAAILIGMSQSHFSEAFAPAVKMISEQTPNMASLYTSRLAASQMMAQSESSLRQTEISNLGQKGGEARDFQSEVVSLLNNARDILKRASQ